MTGNNKQNRLSELIYKHYGKFVWIFLSVALLISIILIALISNASDNWEEESKLNEYSEQIQIYDDINVIDNEDELLEALYEFADGTDIYTHICTVYDEDWQSDYRSLQSYALDRYDEQISDQRHVLIVYSIPEDQGEAYRNGDLVIPDYSFELVQGSRCDSVLTRSVDAEVVHCIWDHLENGDNPGEAIHIAINSIDF